MYKITLIGDKNIVVHNAGGSAPKVIDGTLEEEINAVPSLKFQIYATNPGYGNVIDLDTRVQLYNLRTGEEEFYGRVLQSPATQDSDGKIYQEITCEGELAYLRDTVQAQDRTSGELSTNIFASIISNHNDVVGSTDARRLTLGSCPLAGLPVAVDTGYSTSLDVLSQFAEAFGWEYRARREGDTVYIDIAEAFGEKSKTEIRVRKNLVSMQVKRETSQLVTRLYPFGAVISGGNGKRLTVAPSGQTSGAIYIDNADLIKRYGVYAAVKIFDDIRSSGGSTIGSDSTKLYRRAKAYMDSLTGAQKQYEISALDIVGGGTSLDYYHIYNTYHVSNRLLDVGEDLRITGRTLKISEEWLSTLRFGDKPLTVSEAFVENSRKKKIFVN